VATLVRYRDGELSPKSHQAVEAHLAGCDSCRLDFRLVRAALPQVWGTEARAEIAGILQGVQLKIHQWEAGQSKPESGAEAVRSRVAHQVGLFLGHQAARKILEPVSLDNQNLLSVVERVLGEFLGPRATASVVNDFVSATLVKN